MILVCKNSNEIPSCQQFPSAHGRHVVDVLQRIPVRLAQRQLSQGAEARAAVLLGRGDGAGRRPAAGGGDASRRGAHRRRRHGHHPRHGQQRAVRVRPAQAIHQRTVHHNGRQPADASHSQREKSHSRCSGNPSTTDNRFHSRRSAAQITVQPRSLRGKRRRIQLVKS